LWFDLQGTCKENLRYINTGTEFAGEKDREGDARIGDLRMPISLPPKVRAKAVPAPKQAAIESIDWLGLWALSLGFCAIVLAAVAYFMSGDNTGASCILVGATVLIALIIRCDNGRDEGSGEN
jgi:hypothetical protein